MDSQVAQFVAVTDASPATATQFLSVTDGDVEQAIALFLEANADGDGAAAVIDADAEAAAALADADRTAQDAALARRLQQESGDAVRQPIAPTVQRLNAYEDEDEPVAGMMPLHTGPSSADMASFFEGLREVHRMPPRSVFNQPPPGAASFDLVSDTQGHSSDENHSDAYFDARDTDDEAMPRRRAAPAQARSNRLAQLFRPPFDLLTNASFDDARRLAQHQSRWLLINVQDPTEFDCQRVNRDLWKDDTVRALVKTNFIFVQLQRASDDGIHFSSWYGVDTVPHIAILDPRTGERLRRWDGLPSNEAFISELEDFLGAPTKSNDPASAPTITKSVADMTEDEMLAAAIAASVSDMPTAKHNSPPPSPARLRLEPEPEATPDTTRIQFRMPDGRRLVRRFHKTSPVEQLYAFVQSQAQEPFELNFVREPLKDKQRMSIQDAGLSNAAVHVTPP